MQKLNLDALHLNALSQDEMNETDGGFLPLLVIGACLLISGCVTQREAVKATNPKTLGMDTTRRDTIRH